MATFMKIITKIFSSKIFLVGAALLAVLSFLAGCETEKKPSNENQMQTNSDQNGDGGLIQTDTLSHEDARKNGLTVIHEDTNTPKGDDRCGIGGGRYSSNGKSACDIFTHPNDWYPADKARRTNCPSGFVRVDQAGIGRSGLPGATRQCRTISKVSNTRLYGHFYCPHGSNLIGIRTGVAAYQYGVCKMKCDPDVIHFYMADCAVGKNAEPQPTSLSTSTTTAPPITQPNITYPFVPPTAPTTPSTTATTIAVATTTTIPIATTTTTEPPATPPSENELMPALPSLEIKSAPDGNGLHIVGIDTWFWIDPAEWRDRVKVVIQGEGDNAKTYTSTATPANLTMQVQLPIGNQTRNIDCGSGTGKIWTPDVSNSDVSSSNDRGGNVTSQCSYTWRHSGIHKVQALISWEVSWVCSPNCSSSNLPSSGTLPAQNSLSPEQVFDVTEVQAIIVPN